MSDGALNANDVMGSSYVDIQYKDPVEFDPEGVTITANKQQILSNGVDATIIQVTFRNKVNGELIEGLTGVALTVMSGPFVGDIVELGEVTPGHYRFKVTSLQFGSETFFAGSEMGPSNANVTIRYKLPDMIDSILSTTTVDTDTIFADGEDSAIVTVRLFYSRESDKEPLRPVPNIIDLKLIVKSGKIIADQIFLGEVEPGVYQFKVTSVEVGKETLYFETYGETK